MGKGNQVSIRIGESTTEYAVPAIVGKYFFLQTKTLEKLTKATTEAKKMLEKRDEEIAEAYRRGYEEGKAAAQNVLEKGIDLAPPKEEQEPEAVRTGQCADCDNFRNDEFCTSIPQDSQCGEKHRIICMHCKRRIVFENMLYRYGEESCQCGM